MESTIPKPSQSPEGQPMEAGKPVNGLDAAIAEINAFQAELKQPYVPKTDAELDQAYAKTIGDTAYSLAMERAIDKDGQAALDAFNTYADTGKHNKYTNEAEAAAAVARNAHLAGEDPDKAFEDYFAAKAANQQTKAADVQNARSNVDEALKSTVTDAPAEAAPAASTRAAQAAAKAQRASQGTKGDTPIALPAAPFARPTPRAITATAAGKVEASDPSAHNTVVPAPRQGEAAPVPSDNETTQQIPTVDPATFVGRAEVPAPSDDAAELPPAPAADPWDRLDPNYGEDLDDWFYADPGTPVPEPYRRRKAHEGGLGYEADARNDQQPPTIDVEYIDASGKPAAAASAPSTEGDKPGVIRSASGWVDLTEGARPLPTPAAPEATPAADPVDPAEASRTGLVDGTRVSGVTVPHDPANAEAFPRTAEAGEDAPTEAKFFEEFDPKGEENLIDMMGDEEFAFLKMIADRNDSGSVSEAEYRAVRAALDASEDYPGLGTKLHDRFARDGRFVMAVDTDKRISLTQDGVKLVRAMASTSSNALSQTRKLSAKLNKQDGMMPSEFSVDASGAYVPKPDVKKYHQGDLLIATFNGVDPEIYKGQIARTERKPLGRLGRDAVRRFFEDGRNYYGGNSRDRHDGRGIQQQALFPGENVVSINEKVKNARELKWVNAAPNSEVAGVDMEAMKQQLSPEAFFALDVRRNQAGYKNGLSGRGVPEAWTVTPERVTEQSVALTGWKKFRRDTLGRMLTPKLTDEQLRTIVEGKEGAVKIRNGIPVETRSTLDQYAAPVRDKLAQQYYERFGEQADASLTDAQRAYVDQLPEEDRRYIEDAQRELLNNTALRARELKQIARLSDGDIKHMVESNEYLREPEVLRTAIQDRYNRTHITDLPQPTTAPQGSPAPTPTRTPQPQPRVRAAVPVASPQPEAGRPTWEAAGVNVLDWATAEQLSRINADEARTFTVPLAQAALRNPNNEFLSSEVRGILRSRLLQRATPADDDSVA